MTIGPLMVEVLREIYVSCYNLFLQFSYIIRQLKAVVCMLFCDVLGRKKNPYMESFNEEFRICTKMVKETNKGDVESICARITKHVSKMVVKSELIMKN